jgi:hypothetical protein
MTPEQPVNISQPEANNNDSKDNRKTKTFFRVSCGILALSGIAGALICNHYADKEYDRYSQSYNSTAASSHYNKNHNYLLTRNISGIFSGVCTISLGVSFFF